MLYTTLCDRLKITRPIVQAGMGGIAGSQLAAAVAETGAMGNLSVYRLSPSEIRLLIQQTKKLTQKNFGINFVPDVLSLAELQERIQIALEEGIQVFSFFSQIPPELINELHGQNALVLLQVGSTEQAEIAINSGVDILIVQGWEAGGHLRGQTSLLPLLLSIVRHWSHVPLLAAGGITTGRGLAAALAAGAGGVWIGTRFAASIEAEAHPEYQQKIVNAIAEDTVVTTAFDQGWFNAPHRVLRNKVTESSDISPRKIIGFAQIAEKKVPILRGSVAVPTRTVTGDIDAMAQYSGQGCELIETVESAAQIVRTMMAEAESIINDLHRQIKPKNKEN